MDPFLQKEREDRKMSCSHPNPQFARPGFVSLNGLWSCRFDPGKSGAERGWEKAAEFETPINVPFAPESKLSGLGHTDFIECIWYCRTVSIPAGWQGRVILLHFGGVDYSCNIFIDGKKCGAHTGGASPFTVNITDFVTPGSEHTLVLEVHDEVRSHNQALGKQCTVFASRGCSYTRVTGIWSSVWLESCEALSLEECRIIPDAENGAFHFEPRFRSTPAGSRFRVTVKEGEKTAAAGETRAAPGALLTLTIPEPKLWAPGSPFLYDICFEVLDAAGRVTDTVYSYAGLRTFRAENGRFYLNDEPVFLRMVLDQGFYEDGLWTAPDDSALEHDIELAMKAGFNGARLHQKVFDPRYHYYADKLGFLTFSEFPDWGMGFWQHFTHGPCDVYRSFRDYFSQWREVVTMLRNHPSIIGWTPFNETHAYRDLGEHRRILSDVYRLTRDLDPTRIVCDSSGYVHAETDVWSVHTYAQDPAALAERLATKPVYAAEPENELQAWHGQPFFVGEYGGVKYLPPGRKPWAGGSWGYSAAETEEVTLKRLRELTATVVNSGAAGFCYTQLTDIEQEQNGVYCYDRSAKFPAPELRKIFTMKPDWSKY